MELLNYIKYYLNPIYKPTDLSNLLAHEGSDID